MEDKYRGEVLQSHLEFLPEMQQAVAVTELARHLEVWQLPGLPRAVRARETRQRYKISRKLPIWSAANTSLINLPAISLINSPAGLPREIQDPLNYYFYLELKQ